MNYKETLLNDIYDYVLDKGTIINVREEHTIYSWKYEYFPGATNTPEFNILDRKTHKIYSGLFSMIGVCVLQSKKPYPSNEYTTPDECPRDFKNIRPVAFVDHRIHFVGEDDLLYNMNLNGLLTIHDLLIDNTITPPHKYYMGYYDNSLIDVDTSGRYMIK